MNQIQGNNTIFSTGKGHIKHINTIFIINIGVIDFLYCFLYKLVHDKLVFGNHSRNINESKGNSLRFGCIDNNYFRFGKK